MRLLRLQARSYAFDQMLDSHAGCLSAIRAPLALLLLGAVLLCSQLAAAADVISSSKLESCIADGSQVSMPSLVQ